MNHPRMKPSWMKPPWDEIPFCMNVTRDEYPGYDYPMMNDPFNHVETPMMNPPRIKLSDLGVQDEYFEVLYHYNTLIRLFRI